MKVGITGAGGKVGGVLAKALLSEPHNKYELRLFFFSAPLLSGKTPSATSYTDLTDTILHDIPRQCEVVKGLDFANAEQVKGAFEGLDAVIHLAAIEQKEVYKSAKFDMMVTRSFQGADPYTTWAQLRGPNFDAVMNVYDECVHSKVKRLVFASTNHTQNGILMADPKKFESLDFTKVKQPLTVTDTAYPDCMYAVGKLFGEEVGKLYALQHKLEVVALRIGWLKDYDKDDPSDVVGTLAGDYMRAMYPSVVVTWSV